MISWTKRALFFRSGPVFRSFFIKFLKNAPAAQKDCTVQALFCAYNQNRNDAAWGGRCNISFIAPFFRY